MKYRKISQVNRMTTQVSKVTLKLKLRKTMKEKVTHTHTHQVELMNANRLV